jgi:hypothetical protein
MRRISDAVEDLRVLEERPGLDLVNEFDHAQVDVFVGESVVNVSVPNRGRLDVGMAAKLGGAKVEWEEVIVIKGPEE